MLICILQLLGSLHIADIIADEANLVSPAIFPISPPPKFDRDPGISALPQGIKVGGIVGVRLKQKRGWERLLLV